MSRRAIWYAGLWLVAVVAAIAVVSSLRDRRLAATQRYADSVATAARARDSVVTRYADSLRMLAESLGRARRPIIVRVRTDSAAASRADSAMAAATSARDSNAALVTEVAALRRQVDGFRGLVILDSLRLLAERERGDSLATALRDASRAIADLNARVQALGRRPPRWLRAGWRAAQLGAAAYAGYQLGRASR